jgi:hypothetical protein
MIFKKKILVFPCGSEIGLEIHRSLCFSTHVHLIGASSVSDHGRFVYENYFEGLPFVKHPDFISKIKELVSLHSIDAIYPAMDSVIHVLKKHENEIGCRVISSPVETTEICLSKIKTYEKLEGVVGTPKIYDKNDDNIQFPVFLKPDIGYGSRGVAKANNKEEMLSHLEQQPDCLILEFMPGDEFTIDCFSDTNGKLRFVGARKRKRIMSGISVNTSTEKTDTFFSQMAEFINKSMRFQGAWFFQVKNNKEGRPVLMEVASRLGGSSAVYRAQGVNFALLSIYSSFGMEVSIMPNPYMVELDRALNVCFKMSFEFNMIFVDYDDTIIISNKINTTLLRFLFDCINKNKRLILITRHVGDLEKNLAKHRIVGVFHQIIHLKNGEKKSNFIPNQNAIFIDDSFTERKDVMHICGIPVFSPDMVVDLIV